MVKKLYIKIAIYMNDHPTHSEDHAGYNDCFFVIVSVTDEIVLSFQLDY